MLAIHVLSLSYGKDSLACLGAIEKLGWPLDRIVHAEVWATDTIPADLPPMVEFKAKADAIIKERWGIEVEHICAMRVERERESYESMFYRKLTRGKFAGNIKGFPMVTGAWCKKLKYEKGTIDLSGYILSTHPEEKRENIRLSNDEGRMVQFTAQNGCDKGSRKFLASSDPQGADKNTVVWYLGIAADEPERLKRLDGKIKVSPLNAVGWTEADARLWCEQNDLLSPIYTTATRGGCWFCHNQGVEQLRLLRKNYPELWALLMKWDLDSPVSFHPDGHTVHDFDRRFYFEDLGLVPCDRKFRWKILETAQSKWLNALLNHDS